MVRTTPEPPRVSPTVEPAAEPRGRRTLLLGGAAALLAPTLLAGLWARATRVANAAAPAAPADVTIELFDAKGKSLGRQTVAKIVKTEDEWRSQLSAESFAVTRHEGTERAFTGEYVNNHAAGLYRCICCDTALFDSKTKFESGTGWPSFWAPISKLNVVSATDRSFGTLRDAISCHRCDAHLGHVFDDGPRPTGLRYCMNSVALHFVAFA